MSDTNGTAIVARLPHDKSTAVRLAQAYFDLALRKETQNATKSEIDTVLDKACEYERLAKA